MRLCTITVSVLLAASAHADTVRKRASLDDCLAAAKVPLDALNSTDWAEDVAAFNQRLNYTPVAIAAPTNVRQVQSAVSCAASAGVKVNGKSGGHSYASFGLGGEDGHLVVELDRMNLIEVDNKTKIATVQAGARLGHVATALYAQGRRAISHGTCPGVGVAGHALHGGYGFSSYTHGLALDWILGATVVLANGTAVNCSTTENADLFWALRGAGSSFGIVTSFRFKTFEAPAVVTNFNIFLPWRNYKQAAAGLSVLQDWMQDSLPRELNMRIFGSSFGASLEGMYHGSSSALNEAISPLMAALNTTLTGAREMGWMDAFASHANGQTVDIAHPYDLHETFFAKSLATKALSKEALEATADYWFNEAPTVTRSWYIILDLYGGKNAAITNIPHNSTSYAHRDKLWLFQLYDRSFGSYPEDGFFFLNGWVEAITGKLNRTEWGMYINYADPTMDRTEAQENYWRQSLPKLQQVKAAFDPNDVLYYPQGVKPAAKKA